MASSHLHHKSGCNKCSCSPNVKLNKEQFISRAIQIHGIRYNYSNVNYVGIDEKVNIFCPKHGTFEQTPSSHINAKQGCPGCGNGVPTQNEFVEKCVEVHSTKYDYSQTVYVNMKTKVTILCSKHGKFSQLPSNHLVGTGCPFCSRNVSKPETAWLDSLNVDQKFRNKQINVEGKILKVDAFVPTSNTVYEFWGDFFHGNPRTFEPDAINPRTKTTYKELFEKTQEKRTIIVSNGFKLIEMWEDEWNNT